MMNESDFPNREAYVEARLQHLTHCLQEMGVCECGEGAGLVDPELYLGFLCRVLALAAEACVPAAPDLASEGSQLPPPEDIPADRLADKLQQIIDGLAGLRVFLTNTGHLSDVEFYKELWSEALNEFTWDMSGCTNGGMHLDLLGSGSEEDTRSWLAYYADDQQRREWQDQFPFEELPARKELVSDRDADLPKPDYR